MEHYTTVPSWTGITAAIGPILKYPFQIYCKQKLQYIWPEGQNLCLVGWVTPVTVKLSLGGLTVTVQGGLYKTWPSNLASNVCYNVISSQEMDTQRRRKEKSHSGRDWGREREEGCEMRYKEGKTQRQTKIHAAGEQRQNWSKSRQKMKGRSTTQRTEQEYQGSLCIKKESS